VFIGNLPDGSRICIKFARQYSMTVHDFCAPKGFAPALLGFDQLPGGWLMVVMQAIDDVYQEITAEHRSAIDHIRAEPTTLHQAGYAHGDIRDADVMVRKDGLDWGPAS
jgi:hypothetical protein